MYGERESDYEDSWGREDGHDAVRDGTEEQGGRHLCREHSLSDKAGCVATPVHSPYSLKIYDFINLGKHYGLTWQLTQ